MRLRYAVFVLTVCTSASADYTLTPLSDGASGAVVGTGLSFELDVLLESDAADVHDSAIFRVVFSTPGLEYAGYLWADPYTTGTIYDDSFPFIDLLTPPLALDEDTLVGPGYPVGVVDVELSNVLEPSPPPDPPGMFGEGVITTLTIEVPPGFPLDQPVLISVEPDTIASGFELIDAFSGPPFELTVILSGDFDGDNDVDVDDLTTIILNWGPCPDPPASCPGDVNGDGSVDVDDLVLLILNWTS